VRLLVILISLVFGFVANAESVPLANLGQFNAYANVGYSSTWGYTAPDGREYALLGVETGLSIVDINKAPNLVEVAFIASSIRSSWTEVKTYKHYAYVVKDNAPVGVQIIDLSGLPGSARLVNTVKDYPNNHTIQIEEDRGLMFTVGGDNMGVTVWSLQDPTAPKQIGTFNTSTYVHDMFVRGNRAYLAEIFSKSFSVYDITNPAAPILISRTRDVSAPYISFHNMSLTENGKYLLTTEETSGRPVRVWDLSDERAPKEISKYIGPGNLPHNVHVKVNFAHVAHYGGGYRVVDIRDPKNPVEVAHFNNKSPAPAGFNGVWEVYPFFESGKVIMSSMEDGLFVTEFKGN
jgi:choice-of-anchor B domain-containing protein